MNPINIKSTVAGLSEDESDADGVSTGLIPWLVLGASASAGGETDDKTREVEDCGARAAAAIASLETVQNKM